MVRFVLCLGFFAACAVAQEQAQIQEQHLRESGSAAGPAHSTFASGYRHGYAEGYHAGKNYITMSRAPPAQRGQPRGGKTSLVMQLARRPGSATGLHARCKA